IENQGYLTIGTPIYLSELNQDDVSLDLIPFQEFLNIYYEEDLLEPLRTDGYFDLATKDLLMQFQTEFNLEVNGQLNIETARQIYDLYLSFINDYRFDIQLNRLIEIIKE
ncbi:MAG: peptidoglycan-binding domain-containing protein, partial [Acholeplasmataceae bacterium]|nr:peptidoglycan-binding domain-containing protein [Acholeplasmataceae bacterium]